MDKKQLIEHIGEKIILKRSAREDIFPLYSLVQDPNILDTLTLNVDDLNDWKQYFVFIHKQFELNSNFTYTILNKKTLEIMGQISVYDIRFTHKKVKIGLWLGKMYWNNGYAKDALSTLIKFVFGELKIHRIQAEIFTSNVRSIKLFETLNFQREGMLKDFYIKNKDFVDIYLYYLLNRE